jgi:hypothetical protein
MSIFVSVVIYISLNIESFNCGYGTPLCLCTRQDNSGNVYWRCFKGYASTCVNFFCPQPGNDTGVDMAVSGSCGVYILIQILLLVRTAKQGI